jgi:hypothetical protein
MLRGSITWQSQLWLLGEYCDVVVGSCGVAVVAPMPRLAAGIGDQLAQPAPIRHRDRCFIKVLGRATVN